MAAGDSDLEDAEPDVTAADIEAAERADAAVAAAAGRFFLDEPFITQESVESAQTPHPNGGKRMRLLAKVEDSTTPFLVEAGWEATAAVVPLESSRLSRELETTLYGVDWGSRGNKPDVLLRWGSSASSLPSRLEALANV